MVKTYSLKSVMTQETCTNEFVEDSEKNPEDKAGRGKDGVDKCETQEVTGGYF